MQGKHTRMLQWSKTRTYAGAVVLMTVLWVLSGCATSGKVKRASAVLGLSGAKGPSVARLEDGRQGFIIKEVPQMDAASHRDFERAVAMLEKQDYGRAIDLLEKVIAQSPGVTAPYINIAIAYQHIGKPEQAEEHLKTALRLVPEHPVACNEYGLLYRKSGRFAEAREIYEKTLARFPDYYPVHRNLGILCDLYLNDSACALDHYEIYSQNRPEDRQVKLWIADLRIRFGQN
jgi:Tfp pilus assembly protein PilF